MTKLKSKRRSCAPALKSSPGPVCFGEHLPERDHHLLALEWVRGFPASERRHSGVGRASPNPLSFSSLAAERNLLELEGRACRSQANRS